jgi:hypothetical protein
MKNKFTTNDQRSKMPYQESEEEERNKHEDVTKEKVVMYHLLIYRVFV